MEKYDLIVIGGVAAGLSAASAVKRGRPDWNIVVYERSPHISYASCGLPYFVSGIVPKPPRIFTNEQFEKERKIKVKARHEVVRIDPEQKRVTVKNLETGEIQEAGFETLVIATGAAPKIPTVSGTNLKGIHVVRTLQDGFEMLNQVKEEKPTHGVIAGGGYIGCEMVEALAISGLKVHLVQRSDHFLGTINPEIGDIVAKEFEEHGVEVSLNTKIKEIIGNGAQKVQSVLLDNDEIIPAEFLVLSVGVQPESELARAAGIKVGKTGAIAVNKHQQTNFPYIYAAGDCCEAWNLIKQDWDYIPLGTTANKQGRIAGQHILDGISEFQGIVGTAVSKIFDLEVARTGLSSVECQRRGLKFVTSTIAQKSRAHYYPGGSDITVSLNLEQGTGKLLGAAMAGKEGVSKRIDVLATALHAGMTVFDLQSLDLSYAPPFAPVWDAILIAANVGAKKIK